jgi:putative ABC transport system permease protein
MEKEQPAFASRFLEWFCPPQLLEGIEGDLLEQFEIDKDRSGLAIARRRFVWNVLKFFRPEIILRNKFSQAINNIMIANYVKVAGRNIARKKLYSFINAFGLSIAIAFCVLIYLFIADEKSFDRFHADGERIFMITESNFNNDKFEKGDKDPYSHSAYLPPKLAEVTQEEVKEVEAVTRFCGGEGTMKYKDKVLKQQVQYVDSGFFKVFSFEIVNGSVNGIFKNESDAVLTEEVAKKYFGADDPIGKEFSLDDNGQAQYRVAAIIETPPSNSSITYSVLLPVTKRPYFNTDPDSWGMFSYPTFVKVKPNASVAVFRTNFEAVVDKYLGPKFKKRSERRKLPEGHKIGQVNLVNFFDVHLNTKVTWEKVSDEKYSYILASLSALILVIAAINYVSLALTTSTTRRVEVGVRKVVGAQKSQLVWQFGLEAILLALLSMLLGIGLVVLFLPFFNSFTGKDISFTVQNVFQLTGIALAISLFIGMVAGSYPAFFLSSFKPVSVLKGRFTSKLQAGFTKPLVVLQFALSAFLIISALIMYRQMEYIATKDLGFEKDHVIVIKTNAGWSDASDRAVENFRNRMKTDTDIKAVAGTSASFNHGWSQYGYEINDEKKSSYVYRVDPHYIPLLGIEMKEGRNFDERIATDSSAIIVNEALVKDMGWTDPLNEYLNWRSDTIGKGSKVIGVVKDYHFLSLETEIEPLLLSMDKKNVGYLIDMMVAIDRKNVPQTLDKIRKTWTEMFPDRPFEYSFLDQDIERQYEAYDRWMNIAALSTVLAILIACLGLFGLAGINAVNKTKEIGIRKVMGAGLTNIFVMLNKQYFWMAMLSFAIAMPFSYYVMKEWINGFEFRIDIGWGLFAVSMISGLLLALLTVSYHGFKAATINPAETLKYE